MRQTLIYVGINVAITIVPGKIDYRAHKYQGICVANRNVFFWTLNYMENPVLGVTLIRYQVAFQIFGPYTGALDHFLNVIHYDLSVTQSAGFAK